MTVEQRKLVADLEKRAMEAVEECEKAARQLEMERKAAEVCVCVCLVTCLCSWIELELRIAHMEG